ncbi:hypothetical protein CRENBAI_010778 [Crenichthys baileyi]|uniref:Uncharacterized protein n=1 Tax=Crenichthys baileyi TaxID=28760 RepID=A0AAV9RK16_9TELE
METNECSDVELGQLDIDLNRKSKQHNLTSRNVRAILHEVITHEHVVAMMKAAIRDTQDLPMFEPKMTRSRLKNGCTAGTVFSSPRLPFFRHRSWDDEDSSDEEYFSDEEEEEDTSEEMLLSDADSLASPPRIHLCAPPEHPGQTLGTLQTAAGQVIDQMRSSSCICSSESSFLERLNAVEEELICSSTYTYDQALDRKPAADDGNDGDKGCLAFRTRSKLPLVNVPLDQLEAELLAPDITADMYDQSPAQLEEDRHWTKWLQGLMAPGPEDEADDDDDPEYNILDDLDEPDLEDYRTDRAVQITKKEVNELLEELFETLQEEEVPTEEQEAPLVTAPKFNIPQALRDNSGKIELNQQLTRAACLPLTVARSDEQESTFSSAGPINRDRTAALGLVAVASVCPNWHMWFQRHPLEKLLEAVGKEKEMLLRAVLCLYNIAGLLAETHENGFEAPLAGMLTERRQVVRKQYEAVQQRRALQDTTNHLRNNTKDSSSPLPHALASVFVLASQTCPALHLDPTQKLQLQQQVQQHVQLLTQVYLLSRRIHALNHETHVTKRYLVSKPHRPPLNCKAGFRARWAADCSGKLLR